jgi:hypothetical protein
MPHAHIVEDDPVSAEMLVLPDGSGMDLFQGAAGCRVR